MDDKEFVTIVHPEILADLKAEGAYPLQEEIKYIPLNTGDKLPDYYKTRPDGTITAITRAEYKESQRKYVTRKYQIVPMCGHKFVPEKEPRHVNCEACWFSFFQVYGELTQAVEELYAKHGARAVLQLRSKKFLRNFLKFMGTVAAYKAAVESAALAAKENSGSTSGIEPSTEVSIEDVFAEGTSDAISAPDLSEVYGN